MPDNEIKPNETSPIIPVDDLPTEQQKEQAEQPKRGFMRKPKAPPSIALKTKLDGLIAERETLAADHAKLHENLVETWGTKAADEAAVTVSTHGAKLAALDTIIERATAEYNQAVTAEHAAEIETLTAERAKLIEKRNAAAEALTVLRQAVVMAGIEFDVAGRDLEGALLNATASSMNAQRTVAEIDEAYKQAIDARDICEEKANYLAGAHARVIQAQSEYLDIYHDSLVNEHRAAELSNQGA